MIAKETFKGVHYSLPTGAVWTVQTCTETRSCTQHQSRRLLGWTSTVLPVALSGHKDKIRCNYVFCTACACVFFFLHVLVVKAKRVCVTCLGWRCRGGSHGLLCCVMSMPCLIGDQLGQMQWELCFLTSSGWSVPSIQPTLLQPHQSPACQFAQTASKYCTDYLLIACAAPTCQALVSQDAHLMLR